MIQQERIGGLIFLTETTFYIYKDEGQLDVSHNHPLVTTSSKKIFDSNRKIARERELQEQENEVIILS